MHLHHLEGRRAAQEWSARFEETADPPTPQAVERVYPLHAVADVVVAASLCLPRRSQAEAGRGVQLALVLLAARRHPPSRCFGAAGSAVATTMLSRNRNGKGALAFLEECGLGRHTSVPLQSRRARRARSSLNF